MSAPAPWEDRGPSIIPPDEPILDLHVRVARQRGGSNGWSRPKLSGRIINAYAGFLFTILKALVGATLGLVVVAAAWFIVVILRGQ
jgi:hypothetical protein